MTDRARGLTAPPRSRRDARTQHHQERNRSDGARKGRTVSTYRERRERRVERLEGWAEGREAKAHAEHAKARGIADGIPLGQPVLVGHHSEGRHRRDLARIDGAYRRTAEHAAKAKRHAEKARNIEAQLASSIYSDDEDATDRLRERIEALEAERDRIKAYNASARKAAKHGGTGDTSLLDDAQRANLASIAKHAPYQLRAGGALPAYALSNLSGNIKRNRDRLNELEGRVSCAAHGCGAWFERVEGRAPYCVDHAEERDRAVNGWTPENSRD